MKKKQPGKQAIIYYNDAVIECACGAVFHTGSTVKNMRVEICSHCHPFYQGSEKLVDAAGRIDKFKARLAKKQEKNRKIRKEKNEDRENKSPAD